MKDLEALHIELASRDSVQVVEHFPGHRVIFGKAIRITGDLPPGTPGGTVHPPKGTQGTIHFCFVLDEHPEREASPRRSRR